MINSFVPVILFLPAIILAGGCSAKSDIPPSPMNMEQAASKVITHLKANPNFLHGYKRELAWEAMIRYALATEDPELLHWVVHTASQLGIRAGSEANFRRSPFNCLVYWLYLVTGNENWLPGIIQQNQNYRREVARSVEGAIKHPRGQKRGGGQALLIDALQDYTVRMAMQAKLGEPLEYLSEAARQFRLYYQLLRDPETGLWAQGRGWLEDPATVSPGAWSRGHGWLIKGMVDTLLLLPPDSDASREIKVYLEELADALIAVQQSDGMWHCLLHLPSAESPPEVSGTALIAAFLAIAVDAGFLEGNQYREAARKAFGILPAYVTKEGIVNSVSPGPGPLSELGPWSVQAFPPGDEHGPFAILFAALGAKLLED